MRPSIIQLKQLVFQRIIVDTAKPLDEVSSGEAVNFDFDGVNFRTTVEVGTPLPESEDDRAFIVSLGIVVDNTEGKVVPYKLDLNALGVIEVSDKVEKEARANLAAVNGVSIIYGAIRELVTTLTSRCIPGPLLLPTMDFRDEVEKRADVASPDGGERKKGVARE